jgi:hypothetical protein
VLEVDGLEEEKEQVRLSCRYPIGQLIKKLRQGTRMILRKERKFALIVRVDTGKIWCR